MQFNKELLRHHARNASFISIRIETMLHLLSNLYSNFDPQAKQKPTYYAMYTPNSISQI